MAVPAPTLHEAVQAKDVAKLQTILDEQEDDDKAVALLNVRDANNQTALMVAAKDVSILFYRRRTAFNRLFFLPTQRNMMYSIHNI